MQGCAVALPGGPWHFTFARWQLENLRFFRETMCREPRVSQAQSSGLPSVFLGAYALKFMGLHGNLTQ